MLDHGLERAGWEPQWFIEIDDYCQKILEKHWPDVPRYRDAQTTDPQELAVVNLLAGGFPCQPVSRAAGGKRRKQADERWLWPTLARFIGVLGPSYILLENVPGILDGPVAEVLGDLADLGYDAVWTHLPAAAVGAPHLRYRFFLVAHPVGKRIERCWAAPIPRFPEFSWCENLRGPADLRGRPDIPEPLISRKNHGAARRMDRIGNGVVPALAQWVGERIIEAMNHE